MSLFYVLLHEGVYSVSAFSLGKRQGRVEHRLNDCS
jgi:hypothetical protein